MTDAQAEPEGQSHPQPNSKAQSPAVQTVPAAKAANLKQSQQQAPQQLGSSGRPAHRKGAAGGRTGADAYESHHNDNNSKHGHGQRSGGGERRHGGNNAYHNANRYNARNGYHSHLNNDHGVGNPYNRYANSYNKHNVSAVNPSMAAMNMQWQGYYNPQMFYYTPMGTVAPGVMPPGAPDMNDSSGLVSATNEMNGSSPLDKERSSSVETPTVDSPPAKKIEIKTKTGETLDLGKLHSQHLASVQSKSRELTPDIKDFSPVEAPDSVSNHDVIPKVSAVSNTVHAEKESLPIDGVDRESQAELTRKSFLEQVRLRKLAIERKKHGQPEHSNPEPIVNEDKPHIESEDVVVPEKKDDTETKVTAPQINRDASIQEALSVGATPTDVNDGGTGISPLSEAATEIVIQKNSSDGTKNSNHISGVETKSEEDSSYEVPQDTLQLKDETPEQNSAPQSTNEAPIHETTQVTSEEHTESKEEKSEPKKTDTITFEIGDGRAEGDSIPEDEIKEASFTMTTLLEQVSKAHPIEDIYDFKYPDGIERPDVKYKRPHVRYSYGPAFLLQFQSKINVVADEDWQSKVGSKIVIPPGMGKLKQGNKFGSGTGNKMGSFADMRSASLRNMEGRGNSRNSSRRKSKRSDDRRSNMSSYVSRRDRERQDNRDDEKFKDVAPLVPSANRWVPKSKAGKTEKRLAPDGVTELLDKEAVEKKMKSLLNKLTLEKFDRLSQEILDVVNQSQWEEACETLILGIEQIFYKACDEPHWSSMYAQLCGKMVKDINPEIKDKNNEGKSAPMLVLHYLVARCHTEFEKGWTDKLPTNPDGSPLEPELMSDEYYQAAAAKRRGLGLVRFIGYLYRLNLLTGKMMFECFRRLMRDLTDNPSEEILESVVELLNTVGAQFEKDTFRTAKASLEGSTLLDSLFSILQDIIDTGNITSRIKFKLLDVKELRNKKHWNSDRKESGPKTIQQIHEEDQRERMLKSNSRVNSRRHVNNSNSNRNYSRREPSMNSRESFISHRASSSRVSQRQQKQNKEDIPSTPSATNMFDALMDHNEEDE